MEYNYELQREVTEWANNTFPDSTLNGKLHHLFEEFDEVYSDVDSGENKYALEEIADCAFIALHLCSSLGIQAPRLSHELENEIKRKLEINKNRNWGTPDENGVIKHV